MIVMVMVGSQERNGKELRNHVKLLKELGAEYVCNTNDESFMDDLVAALVAA